MNKEENALVRDVLKKHEKSGTGRSSPSRAEITSVKESIMNMSPKMHVKPERF